MNLDLFPELHTELISLLRSLRRDDWLRPTACRDWTVKDIAAHILDGQLRRLSLARDNYIAPGPAVVTHEDTVRMINRMNADWVTAARRFSPTILIDLLEWTAPQIRRYFESLDPDGPAVFPVSWAGETQSKNSFDIAREFSEQWHHQQQIREAVKARALMDAKWLRPVLETFVRALPLAYRDTQGLEGTAVSFIIEGPAGGTWQVRRDEESWKLLNQEASKPVATVRIDQDAAWRLFTKGPKKATIDGDQDLGRVALQAVAVMG
jgi:uncharacterized protein (TIGR03083 family)